MMSDEKCLVKGCPNRRNEGMFKGNLCLPCHYMLSEGRTGPSEAWFVTRIAKLEADYEKACNQAIAEGRIVHKCNERIAKLKAALTKIAHRDVPDASAHGQAFVARDALQEVDLEDVEKLPFGLGPEHFEGRN